MAGHPAAAAIVAAARRCVGTRFRAQGRTPGLALDCVGVTLIAARAAGAAPTTVPAYQLGGSNEAGLETFLIGAGCRPVDRADPGDLLLIAPAAGRRHLAVATPAGAVHAHAGLGRVVEGPLDPGWTVVARYRLPETA